MADSFLTGPPNIKGTRHATLWFLEEDDLYKTMKPYRLRFDSPDPSVPRTNVINREVKQIPIIDVRGVSRMDFNRTGLTFIELDSSLTYADCADRGRIEELYLKDLKPLLCDMFGTPHVVILGDTARRREQNFPVSHGSDYDDSQPVMVTHIDWTPEEIETKLLVTLGRERTDKILSSHYQYIHVWKPLNGPLKDWPLAYCDPLSVQPYNDLEPIDFVNDDDVCTTEEGIQMYYRPYYRWYYLSDQKTSELAVFRQYDSKMGFGSGVPHVAFPDPTATENEPPRESIELQVVVYYDNDT